jgi:hypothetical protein
MNFPIIFGQTDEFDEARRTKTPYPRLVSWDLVIGHERQAKSNHYQTLKQLASRGGLSPLELWCVVNDKDLRDKGDMTEAKAIEWLRGIGCVAWKTP